MRPVWTQLVLCFAAACSTAPPNERDWGAIAASGYAVPAGASPFVLVGELGELLGARDPRLRDEFAYGITAQWLLRQKLLLPAELRALVPTWRDNLQRGIGEVGTDSVLRRSFSALALSLLAARDLQTPFLEAAELHDLLAAALVYLRDERDLRDYEPVVGWIHATAHTADLLKFLARNPRLGSADLAAILDGVAGKLAVPMLRAFAMGEDDRLALAVLSVVAREDHAAKDVAAFLGTLTTSAGKAASHEPFDPQWFAVEQNVRHFLTALHARLAVAAALPPHAETAREAVADCLRELR